MSREDPDRLSADDAHILGLESAVITGHTLKLVVLGPATSPLDVEALRTAVAERLSSQPRATQRIDTSGPEPRWTEATAFEISDHVRRREEPGCASRDDLWRAVSKLMSEHLDHERPLWTFDLFGPLGDGREAIAVRIHHAMADGISAVRFLDDVLWDRHPEPPPRGTRPGLRAASPQRSRVDEALRMPAAVRRELGHRGSHSPFDRPISAARELAFTVAPLPELKAIGASRPARATVNDVLLAIVAGGLRSWLGAGETALPRLRAQVPVSLHHRDERAGKLGNRDSFLNVDLPLAEADPLTRLDRINAETSKRKLLDDAEELFDLFHALGRVKRVEEAAKRLAGSAREFSLSISNVPGPPVPVSVSGRRVERLFSSSEPAAHHALRISAISCAGIVGIGLCTDPEALPDVARLAVAMDDSYAELRDAAIT
ncbi:MULTISPECIES: wax ester/triacylglycerol synthase domain-containing protein [Rhodococcus]|uniref:diacylglycerol O-acyltransferase n=1 Tax=Rhodococcus jostii TaxID=132919 RepID=A0ABU4CFB2_RHOJO|nr:MULTISPECIES: wax ester/triacylglycerol synthase domain-containing protein [Rhodococcus]MDI9949105.1 wax ester/triacylglycerol synthase family O-acyltransferase [Rhodococcus sp. IEGM 1305]MDV6281948.1 wax ester/triacylglycerol synthase family O-acyltransferase [Rhodococcus jostii]